MSWYGSSPFMRNIAFALHVLLLSLMGFAEEEKKAQHWNLPPAVAGQDDPTETLLAYSSEVTSLTENLSRVSLHLEPEEAGCHCEQYQAQPMLYFLPDDVLNVIFKWLPVGRQEALSATCKRFRKYYCTYAEELILKNLEHSYFHDWTAESNQKADIWLQEQLESMYEKFRLCKVPDYLINVSKKRPLYSLALLRYLCNRGKLKLQCKTALPEGFTVVGSLAVLPDGRLITANRKRAQPKVSNNPSTWMLSPGRAENPNVVTVLPEGRLAIGSTQGLVEIWSTKHIDEFRCEDYLACLYAKLPVHSITLLPDNRLAVGYMGVIRLWNVSKRTCEMTFRVKGYATCLLVLPNGCLAAGARRAVTIFDTVSGTRIGTLQCDVVVKCMAVLPNGLLVAGSKLWQIESFSSVASLDEYDTLALLQDGRLVLGTNEGTVKVWNVEKGCCESIPVVFDTAISAMVVLPNGNLALSRENGRVEIWDIYHSAGASTLRENCAEVTEKRNQSASP